MFDVDEFVNDCRAAAQGGRAAVKEVLDRALARPSDVEAAFGTPTAASLGVVYSGTDITILNAVWAPGMLFPPHDHRTWAVIGIYGGEEDNVFYRRAGGSIERSGARDVRLGEIVMLGDDVIHHVHNPLAHSFTGGIHVYGGDYLNNPRSTWAGEGSAEGPATFAASQAIFAAANEAVAQR